MDADRRSAVHDLRQPLAAAEMYTHLLTSRLSALGVDPQDPAWEHARVVAEQLRALAQALDRLTDTGAPPG